MANYQRQINLCRIVAQQKKSCSHKRSVDDEEYRSGFFVESRCRCKHGVPSMWNLARASVICKRVVANGQQENAIDSQPTQARLGPQAIFPASSPQVVY